MNPARLRSAVLLRDGFVCQHVDAHGVKCGLDCRMVEKAYHDAISAAIGAHYARLQNCVMQVQKIQSGLQLQGELRAIDHRLRELGFTPGKAFYEVDHEVPLVEGGANDLSNLRTLCRPHHRAVSAELAERRARRPLKAWLPTRVDRSGNVVG